MQGLRLHTLNINRNSQVEDGLAAVLPTFGDLRILGLQETSVTDKAIESLPTLKSLETLNLRQTKITPASLPALARLQALRSLDVSRTSLGKETLEDLHDKIPRCKITWNDGVIDAEPPTSQN